MSSNERFTIGPSEETSTAWVLSGAAALFMLPAALFSYFPVDLGWTAVALLAITLALVLLAGMTGSNLWFVIAGCMVAGFGLAETNSQGFDVARYVVIGASVLATMECLRLAHLARRHGRILPGVYERVFANTAVVVGVMSFAGIAATLIAQSRTFPSWLLLAALLLGGGAALLWGRSISLRAAPEEELWGYGVRPPMPPPPRPR